MSAITSLEDCFAYDSVLVFGVGGSGDVVGYGSDGELSLEELEAGIARAADRDGFLGAWGTTPHVRSELETLLETVETEALRDAGLQTEFETERRRLEST